MLGTFLFVIHIGRLVIVGSLGPLWTRLFECNDIGEGDVANTRWPILAKHRLHSTWLHEVWWDLVLCAKNLDRELRRGAPQLGVRPSLLVVQGGYPYAPHHP